MLHHLHHLLHPLKVLWRERIDLFWPIWSAITAISVMLVIWVVPGKKSVPLGFDSVPAAQLVTHSHPCGDLPVFVFGLLHCRVAGMGRFYIL